MAPESKTVLSGSDEVPPGLDEALGEGTWEAWCQIRPYLPSGSYLAGGTGVAVHLRHRVSRDLDFFTTVSLDVDALHEHLERTSLPYVMESLRPLAGNMVITLGRTKIDFSDASANPLTEPPVNVAGIEVAGLGDILAMKLAVITKRRQLRDYEDLRAIERLGGRRLEEGLALARLRYRLPAEEDIVPMVAALAGVDECEEDEMVGTSKSDLVRFFHERLPEVVASLSRWDVAALPPAIAAKVAQILARDP